MSGRNIKTTRICPFVMGGGRGEPDRYINDSLLPNAVFFFFFFLLSRIRSSSHQNCRVGSLDPFLPVESLRPPIMDITASLKLQRQTCRSEFKHPPVPRKTSLRHASRAARFQAICLLPALLAYQNHKNTDPKSSALHVSQRNEEF